MLHYTGASFFVICLHATFYNFDALDLMDDQQELTGSIVEEVWSCKKRKKKSIFCHSNTTNICFNYLSTLTFLILKKIFMKLNYL